jgi:phospho-N-acetylmuramoyl-pentapeptide-transferase
MKAFWIALIISAVASFPIMKLLAAMKSKQTVSQFAPEGHQLKQGTPTMGGLIILAGIFGAMPFVETKLTMSFWGGSVSLVPIATLMALFALIGFVDDYVVPRLMPGKRGLGWKQKIVMQVVAAVIPLMMAGYTTPLMLGFGTFMILFFANAYNFSDGLDGLAGTLLIGLLVGMFGLTAKSVSLKADGMDHIYVPVLLFVVLGAVIPFLFWNAPKAKVFMGDVGSLPIGAFLGGFWFLQGYDLTDMTGNPHHVIVPQKLFFSMLAITIVAFAK